MQPPEARQECVTVGNGVFVLHILPKPSFLICKVLKWVCVAEVCCLEGTGGSLAGEARRQADQEENLLVAVWRLGVCWGVTCKHVICEGGMNYRCRFGTAHMSMLLGVNLAFPMCLAYALPLSYTLGSHLTSHFETRVLLSYPG